MLNPNNAPQRVGQYILLEKLGSGAFASVYRCEHVITHQKFAGKLYSVDFVLSMDGFKLWRKEISILQLLCNPRVIGFQEVVCTSRGMLIVMELVEGRTLLDVMPRSGGLPESFARPVVKQILEALIFLHCNGIVHRDIKLENIMIMNDGNIKLVDFGLADYVPGNSSKEGLLIKNQCGSPHYYAPEMIRARENEEFHGGKVDIWATGVLVYSMVTGYHPFFTEDDDKSALLEQIVEQEVPFENDMSAELESLLKKILNKDPANRATLSDIDNHPWTNNTVIAHEAVGWAPRDLETKEMHALQKVVTTNSFDERWLEKRDDVDFLKSLSGNDNNPKPDSQPQKTKSSTEAIYKDQDKGPNDRNTKTIEMAKLLPTPKCKKSTFDASNFESKLRKHLKFCLKGVFKNGRSTGSSRKAANKLSKEPSFSTMQILGDKSLSPLTHSLSSFDHSLGNRVASRDSEKGDEESSHGGFFWKMSLACWMNI